MIWLLFKNCGKSKKNSVRPGEDGTKNGPNRMVRELLPRLDAVVGDPADDGVQLVFVTDAHFACLSVIAADCVTATVDRDDGGSDSIVILENGDQRDVAVACSGKNRCAKVTEELLESLQCPFTWRLQRGDADPRTRHRVVLDRVHDKYGMYNTDIRRSAAFSFEKYISNLIIGCSLTKQNRAHDKLIDVWGWLDKLDDEYEPFYASIRFGLKHIVMSALCHVLFAQDKVKCQQLFEMTTRFNTLCTKSRAAVYAVRAAVCMEYGGVALTDAVEYAKKACDLDPDTAQWNYYRSVALTARRQHLNTYKSCPADDEFDAVQRAIISTKDPNAYFEFHRTMLMKNKILYRYRFENRNNRNNVIKSVSPEQVQRDFHNVIELIKAIMCMEPEDPHLIVKCAKSLLTLPYLNHDNVHLAKQIISIAINVGFNDPSVIEAVKDTIETYRKLVDIYREMREEKMHSESEADVRDHAVRRDDKDEDDNSLENDLQLIADKHRKGVGKPKSDLIGLLDKYDGGNDRWKITAQICSYSILFKDPANFLVTVVEEFASLIEDHAVANSDIITNHRSLFIEDRSKVFNLAELVCNEIKMAIAFGHVKHPNETQFYLDYLTKITEVCRLKSKKTNVDFVSELLETHNVVPVQQSVPQLVDSSFNEQSELNVLETCKPIAPQNAKKKHRRLSKKMPNNQTRMIKYKLRRRSHYHQ